MPSVVARGTSVGVGMVQAIGLVGLARILVGGLMSIVLPRIEPPVSTFGAGPSSLFAGGAVLWVGILGAWVQGIARATRAWDEARKEHGAPPK